jgi:hypothetical protein
MGYARHEDRLAASRRHYLKNREVYIARNAERKREFSRVRDEAKARPCADCGVQYPPYVMQFDHQRDKSFGISDISAIASMKRLLEEIAKCDIVCANCHFERTWGGSRRTEAPLVDDVPPQGVEP